jgi:putative transposase
MPKGLKRYYGQGQLHFLTFSCHRRLPLLGTVRARNLFLQALGKIREGYKFSLVGYVVMPNHVHLLISETPKATPSVVLKVLKQRVSRDLRKGRHRRPAGQLRLAFAKGDEGLPRFWQPRFYDFNVWSKKESSREARVHACESRDQKAGGASEGLAVE